MTILNPNLIAKTSPKCSSEQCITGQDYRISVLSPELLRVEVNKNNVFLDKATQSVWFRDFYKTPYKVDDKGKYLLVETEKVIFQFDLKRLKISYVTFKDTGVRVRCNNKHNLKGTARTLDGTFGPTRLKSGVISRNGVAIMDDSKSLVLDNDGVVKLRDNEANDYYIFAYGRDYRKALGDLFKLCGKVPLIPRYVLGNWWSRYRAYTQDEYISLMQKFMDEDIPITVATVDMDWHWVDVNNKFNCNYRTCWGGPGWTGYSWNTDLFPDYRAFLKWLQDNNFKVPLNLHPADGVRPFEDMYEEMAKEMGVDPATKQTIEFDIADPRFINAYFKVLHYPYEKEGVDFWWMDWQQGTKSRVKGLDPLWSLNHYHFLDNAKDKRPLLLSRYSGIGSHRYPLGFSGDTAMNWRVLNFQPYFTANATNVGYTWWSHDIGGHHLGRRDEELYLRWIQFGLFSPIMRLHSTSHDLLGKEPWNYSKEIEIFTKEQLRLRHSLIPYLYTMNYLTYSQDLALTEPMYYRHSDIDDAYNVPNQYYFGTELIVCPITRKMDTRLKMAYVDAWLPEGRWTDIFNGRIYQGDKWVRMLRGLESIPVLAKEGAIIPMSNDKGNICSNPKDMTLLVYRGNSSFELYEDQGEDNGYLKGEFAKTLLEVDDKDKVLTFKINKPQGDLNIIPAERKYTIYFKDIISADKIKVSVNDKKADYTVVKGNTLTIEINSLNSNDKLVISLSQYTELSNIDYKEATVNMLSRYQCGNIMKMLKYRKLKGDLSKEEYLKKVFRLRIPKIVKDAIREYLN